MAGFLGVLIVVRPDPGQPSAGVLPAAGSAVGVAGSALFTKRLIRHEGAISILFWLTLMQEGMALCAALILVANWVNIRLAAAGTAQQPNVTSS